MSNLQTYTVHRAMHGDGRDYARGDERKMTEQDAKPLVQSGALALKGEVPMQRPEPVLHTFGAAKLDDRDAALALDTPDVSDSRVEGRRSPAKK